ncbi:hypothetical protein H7Y40_01935 [Pedobacter sp.]|nr:hypothetical protein [Candidatus Saccharibacteria bacterium]
MRGKNTIFINGQHYDAVTGLPVESAKPTQPIAAAVPAPTYKVISDFGPARPNKHTVKPVKVAPVHPVVQRPTPTKKVHAAPQRSQTLRREAVKRPVGIHESIVQRSHRTPLAVAKSTAVTRFASHPLPRLVSEPATPVMLPATHKPVVIQPAIVAKAHRAVAHRATATLVAKKPAMSSRELKEHLIAEKLAAVDIHKKAAKSPRKKFFAQPRTTSIVSACFALIVLGGYLTYLNMPNLSVRVAASQSGVDARFPEYRPDGYRFNGPIAYAPGEVSMKFQANGGSQGYEIKQKSSSWDSQAVLDNYVTKQSSSYLTYSEQGLTVYTYGSEAAWVNGGVLYTLEGDAPLSNEQVLRIASSM